MRTRIPVAGAGGALVMILLSFVANVVFGLRSRIDLNRVPHERRVYSMLKENITVPGGYVVNPELAADGRFPPGEPVFSIRFGGSGHEAARGAFYMELVGILLASTLAAWLVSLSSERVLRRYWTTVGMFVVIGVVIAAPRLSTAGIGGYPMRSVVALVIYDIVAWASCGLFAAWILRRGTDIAPGTTNAAR